VGERIFDDLAGVGIEASDVVHQRPAIDRRDLDSPAADAVTNPVQQAWNDPSCGIIGSSCELIWSTREPLSTKKVR
jgi:hypothetical protein